VNVNLNLNGEVQVQAGKVCETNNDIIMLVRHGHGTTTSTTTSSSSTYYTTTSTTSSSVANLYVWRVLLTNLLRHLVGPISRSNLPVHFSWQL
jgi:hypothetical protein